MVITNCKYTKHSLSDINTGIFCEINGDESSVPIDSANTDYAEIMRQVNAGTLTIADAD
tara:strand:- start:227 stop:403 length:177 start_codon:yes stop_codon:yes gene_type:complete